MNALKHGATACYESVLPGESIHEYVRLEDRLNEETLPATILEEVQVDKIRDCIWIQRRILRAESQILRYYMAEHKADVGLEVTGNPSCILYDFEPDIVYHSGEEPSEPKTISVEDLPHGTRELMRFEDMKQEAGATLDDLIGSVGSAFRRDILGPEALVKLQRYGGLNDAKYYRALAELERLQSNRKKREI